MLLDQGRLIAVAALWDQQAFKQAVVRRYAPPLALARPLLNTVAPLTGLPRLPRVGSPLDHAFVSHFACVAGAEQTILRLLPLLRVQANRRGKSALTLGFSTADPVHAVVERARLGRRYQSQLYVVDWAESPDAPPTLDSRPAAPDVALL